ncbi:MAG: hypothetical protein JJE39_12545 [Vicinamibacteria bacterium]|nr:hypothetical protein [Vicinamibacteria bacterium]
MNETLATSAIPSANSEPEIVPCRRIRTKMYYVLGRQAVDLRTSSPTSQYWCSRTATVIGPDDICCSPELCRSNRACYEAEE